MFILGKTAVKWCYYVAASLIILFALFVSLIRLSAPLIQNYHQQIQDRIAIALDKPVQIGAIEIGLYKLKPVLRIVDLQLYQPDDLSNPSLQIDQVTVGINVWSSLWARNIEPSFLVASGAGILAQRTADGTILIGGFKTADNPDWVHVERLIHWLLRQQQFTLQDITVHWVDAAGAVIRASEVSFSISNKGDTSIIRGTGELKQMIPTQFILHAQLDHAAIDAKQGNFYLEITDLSLGQWWSDRQLFDWQVNHGLVDAQIWGEIEQDKLSLAHGHFVAQYVELSNPTQQHFVQHLSGNMMWHGDWKRWQLAADQLELKLDGVVWPENHLSVTYSAHEAEDTWQIMLGQIPVQHVLPILPAALPLPTLLTELTPTGLLHQTYLTIPDQGAWQLQSSLHDFSWRAAEAIPGIKGLYAQLYLQSDIGYLTLDTQTAWSVDVPHAFHEPLVFQTATGDLMWQRASTGLRVTGENLLLENQVITAAADFAVQLTEDDDTSDIDLCVEFALTELSNIYDYLPQRVIFPAVWRWLENAEIDGDRMEGTLQLQGNLADFPFDQEPGILRLEADLFGGALTYLPNWPRISNIYSHLVFQNRDMHATIERASLLDIPIEAIDIAVYGSGSGRELLMIEGTMYGDSIDGMAFVQHSPVGEHMKAFDQLYLQGPMQLSLLISVPLKTPEFTVHGDIVLHDNTVTIPAWQLQLDNMAGQLHFSEIGIVDGYLESQLEDYPFTMRLKTQVERERDNITQVDFVGELGASILEKYMDTPADMVQGKMDYSGQLLISGDGTAGYELTAETDLTGLAVNLPEPFAKSSEQVMPLYVTVEIAERDYILGNAQYDQPLGVQILFNYIDGTYQFDRGEVRLGSKQAVLPSQPGMHIVGTIPEFVLTDWLPYATAAPANTTMRYIDTRIHHLDLWGRQFADVDLKARYSDVWEATISGDAINGSFYYPQPDTGGLQAQFQQVRMATTDDAAAENEDDVATTDPRHIIPLDISIDDLVYGERSLGQLRLVTQSNEEGMLIEVLDMTSPNYTLKTVGSWYYADSDTVTNLRGYITSNDLQETAHAWSKPTAVDARYAELRFDLNWPGAPNTIVAKDLQGTANFKLQRGQINNLGAGTEDKIEKGKVLNLLSLQTIPRRLSLDFSDLSQGGFSFDTLQGELVLHQGLVTVEDAYLNGPVAYINVTGDVDLAAETYDFIIEVTPYLTASLPVVAAIAGGPVIGMATWAADRVIHHGMRELIAYKYHITGPWDDPEIEKV